MAKSINNQLINQAAMFAAGKALQLDEDFVLQRIKQLSQSDAAASMVENRQAEVQEAKDKRNVVSVDEIAAKEEQIKEELTDLFNKEVRKIKARAQYESVPQNYVADAIAGVRRQVEQRFEEEMRLYRKNNVTAEESAAKDRVVKGRTSEKVEAMIIDDLIDKSAINFDNVARPSGQDVIRYAKRLARQSGENYNKLSAEQKAVYYSQAMSGAVAAENDIADAVRTKSSIVETDPALADDPTQRRRTVFNDQKERAFLTQQNNIGNLTTPVQQEGYDEGNVDPNAASFTDESGYEEQGSLGITAEDIQERDRNTFIINGEEVTLRPDQPIPDEARQTSIGGAKPTQYERDTAKSWRGGMARARVAGGRPGDASDLSAYLGDTETFNDAEVRRTFPDADNPSFDRGALAATRERRERRIVAEYVQLRESGQLPALDTRGAEEARFEAYRAERMGEMGDLSPTYVTDENGRTRVVRMRQSFDDPQSNFVSGRGISTTERVTDLPPSSGGVAGAEIERRLLKAVNDGELQLSDPRVERLLRRNSANAGRVLRAADRDESNRLIEADPGFRSLSLAEQGTAPPTPFLDESRRTDYFLTDIPGKKESMMDPGAEIKVEGPVGDSYVNMYGDRYFKDERGREVDVVLGTPDPLTLREMETDLVRNERNARLAATAGALAEARSGKRFFSMTDAEEVTEVAQSLGLDPTNLDVRSEVAARIAEVSQESRMGMTAREVANATNFPAIVTGETVQVDLGKTLQNALDESNKIIRKAQVEVGFDGREMPYIRSVADFDLLAEETLRASAALNRGGKPSVAGMEVHRTLGTEKPQTRFVAGPGDTYGDSGIRGGFSEYLNTISPEAPVRDNIVRAVQTLAAKEDFVAQTGISQERLDRAQRGGAYSIPGEGVIVSEREPRWGSPEYMERYFTRVEGAVGNKDSDPRSPAFDDKGQGFGGIPETGLNATQLAKAYRGSNNQTPTGAAKPVVRRYSLEDAQAFAAQGPKKAALIYDDPGSPGTKLIQTEKIGSVEGTPVSVQDAADFLQRRFEREGSWTNEAYRNQYTAGVLEKQQMALNAAATGRVIPDTIRPRDIVPTKLPRATDFDFNNDGLVQAELLARDIELAGRDTGNTQFLSQQSAPLTNEAVTLGQLRAERGNLDDGVPLEINAGLVDPRLEVYRQATADASYYVPKTVKENNSVPVQLKGSVNPNDPMIDAQFRQAQMLAGQNPVQAGPASDLAVSRDLSLNALGDGVVAEGAVNRGVVRGDRRPVQGPTRPVVQFAGPSPITAESARRKKVYDAVAAKDPSELPNVNRPDGGFDPGYFIDERTGERIQRGAGRTAADYAQRRLMVEDPWEGATPVARAQAPDVKPTFSSPVIALPPSREVADNMQPPAQRTQDASVARTFATQGVTPIQDVTPPATSVADPSTQTRAPELLGERQAQTYRGDGAGGGGRVIDTNLGGYRTRGGDIYQERQRRTENNQRRFRRPTGRELGIGAAAAGGIAGIAGLNSLINGEREEREVQR